MACLYPLIDGPRLLLSASRWVFLYMVEVTTGQAHLRDSGTCQPPGRGKDCTLTPSSPLRIVYIYILGEDGMGMACFTLSHPEI